MVPSFLVTQSRSGLLDGLDQFLAGFEAGHPAGPDGDSLPGAGVAARAGLALGDAEGPEPH